MIIRFASRILLGLLSCQLSLSLYSAESAGSVAPAPSTNIDFQVSPGPTDGRIAYVTARLLEQLHYSRQPFDHSVSGKLLDRYLDSLDPQHLHFLQADLEDFEPYRSSLDRLTIRQRGVADVRPACEIFNRFVKRLEERVAYVDDILKTEKFTFDDDDKIPINRHEAAYPKDMDEAKHLWRERLRAEYLQEHLNKLAAKKKAETTPRPDADESGTNATAVADSKSDAKPKTEAEEIVATLTHRYQRTLRTFTDSNNEDVLQVYLSALAHVYDPHSEYLGRAQLDSFSINMNLSLFGIGAELFSDDGYCTIRRLLPGGPAVRSKKVFENDRIVAVAQSNSPPVDLVDMNLSKAVQLIRGPKGTEVRLTIVPAGQDITARRQISLIRDEIKLEDQEAKAKVIEMPGVSEEPVRLGVIDLPSFYASFDVGNRRQELAGQDASGSPKSTTTDVERLIKKLKREKVGGIILDLRRNGGGSLEEAIRLTGLFIKEGPVVQVREPDGKVQIDEDPDPSIQYDGPLIVLTSRFSASASEILAGALQDYGRALIVGDSSTHGKGTVQSVNPLRPFMHLPDSLATNEPGALKVTIKKFYRASGASTQLKGVVPDIILPSILNDSKEVGETALDNPLEWDTIKSAKYDKVNMVEPYLPELQRRSAERVAADKEYAYVREDIQRYQKQQADKTLSLNEKQRLKEADEAEARRKAREAERRSRKEPKEIVHEITLRQVDLPGLPPPVEKTNATVARVSNSKSNISSASITNAPVAANQPQVNPSATPDDALEEDHASGAPDVSLTEAEHILMDYLAAMGKISFTAARRE